MAKTLITALGETKQIYEWAKDPRCAVAPNTLSCRIGRGWEPDRAILEPPNVNGRDFVYSKLTEKDIPEIFRLREEELLSFRELSNIYGVTTADIGYVLNRICWSWVEVQHEYTAGRIWIGKDGTRCKIPNK